MLRSRWSATWPMGALPAGTGTGRWRRLAAAGVRPGDAGLAGQLAAIMSDPEVEDRLPEPGWIGGGGPRRLVDRLLPDRSERFLARVGLLLSSGSAFFGLIVVLVVLSGTITVLPQPDGPIEMPEDPVWLLLLGFVWVVVGLAHTVCSCCTSGPGSRRLTCAWAQAELSPAPTGATGVTPSHRYPGRAPLGPLRRRKTHGGDRRWGQSRRSHRVTCENPAIACSSPRQSRAPQPPLERPAAWRSSSRSRSRSPRLPAWSRRRRRVPGMPTASARARSRS